MKRQLKERAAAFAAAYLRGVDGWIVFGQVGFPSIDAKQKTGQGHRFQTSIDPDRPLHLGFQKENAQVNCSS